MGFETERQAEAELAYGNLRVVELKKGLSFPAALGLLNYLLLLFVITEDESDGQCIDRFVSELCAEFLPAVRNIKLCELEPDSGSDG